MKHTSHISLLALLSLSALAIAPVTAHAQSKSPRVSMYLRDVPVRTALQQALNKAGVQSSVDPRITGYVTMRIRNQPLQTALKLIMRNSTVPLTYTKENNVYIVRQRQVTPAISNTQYASYDAPEVQSNVNTGIPIPYVEPIAVQQPLSPIYYAPPFLYPYYYSPYAQPLYLGGSVIMGGPIPGVGGFNNFTGGGLNSFGNFGGPNGGVVPGNFGGSNFGVWRNF